MNILTTYRNEITLHHQQAQLKAVEAVQHAIEAGMLLNAAKAEVQHGQWLSFLESTGINTRTAQRYMRLANKKDQLKCDSGDVFTVTQALEHLARPNQTLYDVMCQRIHDYHELILAPGDHDIALMDLLYRAAKQAVDECRDWLMSLDAHDLTLEQWAAIANNHEPEEMLGQVRFESERRVNALIAQVVPRNG